VTASPGVAYLGALSNLYAAKNHLASCEAIADIENLKLLSVSQPPKPSIKLLLVLYALTRSLKPATCNCPECPERCVLRCSA
jgi:hypothetical protein